VRYFVWAKKDANPADTLGWKEKVKNTPGVMVIGPMENDRLLIEAGFDPINLLRHQLGAVCNFEREILSRFDV
jgi:hypothetical protein